eukprot:4098035-Amphidinium_carterae.1
MPSVAVATQAQVSTMSGFLEGGTFTSFCKLCSTHCTDLGQPVTFRLASFLPQLHHQPPRLLKATRQPKQYKEDNQDAAADGRSDC